MKIKGVVLACIVMAGCSSQIRPVMLPGTSRPLGQVEMDKAFDASVRAVRERFGIAEIDRDNYLVRGAPEYYTAKDDARTLASQISPSRGSFRKVVTVHVQPTPNTRPKASVRIEIQRHDTQVLHAFAYQRQRSDSPAATPIAESSPQGRQQTEVWTFVRRDIAEEQNILKAIVSAIDSTKQ